MTPAPPWIPPNQVPGPAPGPAGLVVNAAGEVFFSDYVKNQVLKVSGEGVVTLVAGTGTEGFSGDGGRAVEANLSKPMGLTLDASGNLYIADYGNARVRKVSGDGVISTVVSRDQHYGNLSHRQDAEIDRKVKFPGPSELAVDGSGNLYMADIVSHVVSMMTPDGTLRQIAGRQTEYRYEGEGGPSVDATLSPYALAADNKGNLYIGLSRRRIVRITAGGTISTVSDSTGKRGYSGDGTLADDRIDDQQIFRPWSLATDADGNLYFADIRTPWWITSRPEYTPENFVIRKILPSDGTITTIATGPPLRQR